MYGKIKNISILLCAFSIISCTSGLQKRLNLADKIASSHNFEKQEIDAGTFFLTTYNKITNKNKPLSIYIEGDGYAWLTPTLISPNPTPRDPLMLRLASEDPAENVIYIARPCQYTPFDRNNRCYNQSYWTDSRFSEEVIVAVNNAITQYTKRVNKQPINLIGYSGGAAVAAFVAERRHDVASLRTVAGNLDHVAVNEYHKVDQLKDSLNPIDIANKLSNLPQHHFAGEKDEIVPLETIENFAKKSENGGGCVKVSLIKGATHHDGWVKHWQEILSQPVNCNQPQEKKKKGK